MTPAMDAPGATPSPNMPVPTTAAIAKDTPSGENVEELSSKYLAWIAKLESNIGDMHRQRRTFRLMFFGSVVISAIGFFWGVWVGVGALATGIMVCSAGLYITMTREWEYQRELASTRAQLARIKG